MYKTLSNSGQQPVDSIPKVYYIGRLHLYTILVIDLFKPSLENIFRGLKWKFIVKTVAMLAKWMVYACR